MEFMSNNLLMSQIAINFTFLLKEFSITLCGYSFMIIFLYNANHIYAILSL